MLFSRLRIAGFKSFVEPTELYIEPGLTGIVGPNGCGKSNISEALRWVMGETSAKQIRGGEMDDVIFTGTADRPGRNLAEVMVTLDNSDRTAPASYNGEEEINITRRIERGSGSSYKINGREVRARDVQTLFADAASGARSSAMVGQGRIGAIINAKPTERRVLLEEAAGVMGLQSRRHEAELRLRAAEANLERLDDLLATMDTQLRGLKRQARQAKRYRNLSDHIRRAEAVVLHHRWTAAREAEEAARKELRQAEEAVGEITAQVAAATTVQAEAAAELPGLRQNEAEAAAALQRLLVARDALEQEEKRLEEMRRDLEARQAQIDHDTEREGALRSDAVEATERLDAEAEGIRRESTGEEAEIARSRELVAESEAKVAALDRAVSETMRAVAAAEARHAALTRQVSEFEQRRDRLTQRLEDVSTQLCEAEEDTRDRGAWDRARAAVAEARDALAQRRTALEEAERARGEAQHAEGEAREHLRSAETATANLKAEEKALSEVLQLGDSELWPPMIDAVEVAPGYETALGAALGDDLLGPSDESAPVHWRGLPADPSAPPLPAGAEPLDRYVKAPPALARRLAQIGIVADREDAERLRGQLAQGQRLVSRGGGMWRWDGFTTAEGASTSAARRLEQRNRLIELKLEVRLAEAREAEARASFDGAHGQAEAALGAEKEARDSAWSSDRAFQEARDQETAAAAAAANARSQLESLTEAKQRLGADIAEIESSVEACRRELETLADLSQRRQEADRQRAELEAQRAVHAENSSARDRIQREAEARIARLNAIATDLASWRERVEHADGRLQQLGGRRQDVADDAGRLEARPTEIARQRDALFSQIEGAETRRNQAADTLAVAETRLEESSRELRAKEARLAAAREDRIRREGALEHAESELETVTDRIAERLQCRPEEALAEGGVKEGQEPPPYADIERKLERLLRERDNMGPVNLRAEIEAAELDERITTLQGEREDLVAAVSKLRQGISSLNREGRQRLVTAFEEVDGHFRDLFARLFGGGRAHLAMTEGQDPLEAGLEIMASPPGKRLQRMSLLSGGEQALTAMALLFAVFMTNPAPVCVLDEVDAPLDDNNVDRFCTLLEEIADQSSTRFLLITHHRMTMARMDRLYGVTMTERGVSQLVSVDLQTAESMRETA